jgi:hypothetical protein
MEIISQQVLDQSSAAHVLREGVIDRIAAVIDMINSISDSSIRLPLQATCLDLIISVEGVISAFKLEADEPIKRAQV